MRKVSLSKDAEKFLLRLPPKQSGQISRKLKDLEENPLPPDASKLKGYPFMRTDFGEFRIIYEVMQKTVDVYLIGKRNDDEVYKKLKRKR